MSQPENSLPKTLRQLRDLRMLEFDSKFEGRPEINVINELIADSMNVLEIMYVAINSDPKNEGYEPFINKPKE